MKEIQLRPEHIDDPRNFGEGELIEGRPGRSLGRGEGKGEEESAEDGGNATCSGSPLPEHSDQEGHHQAGYQLHLVGSHVDKERRLGVGVHDQNGDESGDDNEDGDPYSTNPN